MRVRLHRCRHISTRILVFLLLLLGFGTYSYYNSMPSTSFTKTANNLASNKDVDVSGAIMLTSRSTRKEQARPEQCPLLEESTADVNTVSVYSSFDFQPSWVRTKEFWDRSFEERYEKIRNSSARPKLKVIVVPHSHNDPGWLRTFDQYFEIKTKNILNNIVLKLFEYPNMTFIWTEISFLSAWWERSHPTKQKGGGHFNSCVNTLQALTL